MAKEVYFKDESKDKIMQGINILADAVQSTLGPSGKTVIIKNNGEEPFTTKDGVTVAMQIDHEDPVINCGIQMVKKVASKTDEDSGDGTTSATVICRKLIQLLLDAKKKSFFDEHEFRRQVNNCLENVIEKIKDHSLKIDIKDISKVAWTSSNNDPVLTKLFQEAFDNCGADGYINIVESTTGESYVDVIKGYVVELGYMERTFANNSLTGFFEAKESLILIYDNEFTSKSEIIKLIKKKNGYSKSIPLLIIAKDYSKDVLANVEFNNSGISSKICLIKNPLRNDEYKTLLQDISAYSGAEIVTEYDEFEEPLGKVSNLIVKQGYTIMGENPGTQNEILIEYLENLETAQKTEASHFYSEMMRKRISRMRHGVTTFYVGGYSEIELKEKKHRVEDAYKACKAALKSDVVMGGGQLVYLIAQEELPLATEYQKIFLNSIASVFYQILFNSLHSNELIKGIEKNISFEKGYNAKTRNFENLIDSGIVDPVAIVINSIKNAVSIALTVSSTECLIVETQNKNQE